MIEVTRMNHSTTGSRGGLLVHCRISSDLVEIRQKLSESLVSDYDKKLSDVGMTMIPIEMAKFWRFPTPYNFLLASKIKDSGNL